VDRYGKMDSNPNGGDLEGCALALKNMGNALIGLMVLLCAGTCVIIAIVGLLSK
jgi:hypothetical protein